MSELNQDQREAIRTGTVRHDGRKLIATCLIAGLLVGLSIFYRAHLNAETASQICLKVDRLNAALITLTSSYGAPTRPGEPFFDYFQSHPGERATLVAGQAEQTKKALRILRSAACDPSELPAVRGAP